MTWTLLAAGYLTAGVLVAAATPAIVRTLSTVAARTDDGFLGAVAFAWPLAVALFTVVVAARSLGWASRELPRAAGRAANFINTQTRQGWGEQENHDTRDPP